MIRVTVSSLSSFCWLHRAPPPLNIISLIPVLTVCWCARVESPLVLLEEGLCCDQCVLFPKLCQPLPCFTLSSTAKLACYSRCLLTSYFCLPVPYDEKDIFSWCWVVPLSLPRARDPSCGLTFQKGSAVTWPPLTDFLPDALPTHSSPRPDFIICCPLTSLSHLFPGWWSFSQAGAASTLPWQQEFLSKSQALAESTSPLPCLRLGPGHM